MYEKLTSDQKKDEYCECVLCISNTQTSNNCGSVVSQSFYSISCQFVGSKSQGASNMCGWTDVFTCICHWYTRQTVETDVVQTRLTAMVPDEWHVNYDSGVGNNLNKQMTLLRRDKGNWKN